MTFPVPPVEATVKELGIVPPTQIVWAANGCVEIVGSGFTIIVETLEVSVEHPPEPKLMTQ